jgi:predicted DNA-binding protein (UPF0251 family)
MLKLNELKAEIARNELTIEDLADKINISRTTLWRRLNNPSEFTLTEICKIKAILKLSGERIIDIFFTDEVA